MRKGLFSVALVVALTAYFPSLVKGSEQEQEQIFRVSVPAANIRFEPNTASPVIGRAERGTVLKVLGQERDWVKVSFPAEGGLEKVGYILGQLGKLETLQRVSTGSSPAKGEPLPAVLLEPAKEKSDLSVSPEIQRFLSPVPENQAVALPPQESGPGRFGVGLSLAALPGGAVPSILYDLTDRITLNAALGLYTGVTGITGELLYRFSQPAKNPPPDVTFEPYVGGGLIFVNVRFVSESFTGFIGSGGTFITVKKIPRWRFSGDINIVRFNVEDIVLAGLGVRLGVHYFF